MEEKRREEWMAILRQSRLCRNLEEKELQYWYLQIDYTDALENAYVKNDDLEIR